MFYEAEVGKSLAMEVILNADQGTEYVYWVRLKDLPPNDQEDVAIDLATKFHASLGLPSTDEDHTYVYEPFSRCDSEFRWVEIPTP